MRLCNGGRGNEWMMWVHMLICVCVCRWAVTYFTATLFTKEGGMFIQTPVVVRPDPLKLMCGYLSLSLCILQWTFTFVMVWCWRARNSRTCKRSFTRTSGSRTRLKGSFAPSGPLTHLSKNKVWGCRWEERMSTYNEMLHTHTRTHTNSLLAI